MTLQEFAALFPGEAFNVHRVERGPGNRRRWIWFARFTSDYFTSDTDRLVYDHRYHQAPGWPGAEGETPEAALDALAELVLEQKGERAKNAAKHQHEYEQDFAEFRKKLGR